MKTKLEKHFLDSRISLERRVKIMNALQSEGIISDNAIFPGDVSDRDFPAVLEFLDRHCRICGAVRSECVC